MYVGEFGKLLEPVGGFEMALQKKKPPVPLQEALFADKIVATNISTLLRSVVGKHGENVGGETKVEASPGPDSEVKFPAPADNGDGGDNESPAPADNGDGGDNDSEGSSGGFEVTAEAGVIEIKMKDVKISARSGGSVPRRRSSKATALMNVSAFTLNINDV